jgi:uncharacterized membrane protein
MSQKRTILLTLIALVVILLGVLGYVILIKKVPAKQLEMDLPVLKYTPPQAVEKARAFIISKVGQDFFDKYYVLAVDETEKENKDRTVQSERMASSCWLPSLLYRCGVSPSGQYL